MLGQPATALTGTVWYSLSRDCTANKIGYNDPEETLKPIDRRSFLEKAGGSLAVGSVSMSPGAAVSAKEKSKAARASSSKGVLRYGVQNCVTEWEFNSGKTYADPFNDVELDVIFTNEQGREQRVPAFWAGEQSWRVRYSAAIPSG